MEGIDTEGNRQKTYGKLLKANQEGTAALISFENGELEITAYTDFIIRVFSDFSGIRPASFAAWAIRPDF